MERGEWGEEGGGSGRGEGGERESGREGGRGKETVRQKEEEGETERGRDGEKEGDGEGGREEGRLGGREREREIMRASERPRFPKAIGRGRRGGQEERSCRGACRNRWLRLPPSGREPRPGGAQPGLSSPPRRQPAPFLQTETAL